MAYKKVLPYAPTGLFLLAITCAVFSSQDSLPSFESVYTPLGFCPKTCDCDYPDSIVSIGVHCPGLGGLDVDITPDLPKECAGNILFENLDIGGGINRLIAPYDEHIGYKFGHKIEWRTFKKKPFAIILRVKHFYLSGSPLCKDPKIKKETLEVIGLQHMVYKEEYPDCFFSIDVKKTKNANELARQLADSAYCAFTKKSQKH